MWDVGCGVWVVGGGGRREENWFDWFNMVSPSSSPTLHHWITKKNEQVRYTLSQNIEIFRFSGMKDHSTFVLDFLKYFGISQ